MSQKKVPKKNTSKQPVVFIHGHMGGVLVDSLGKKVWLSPRMGLGLETPNLSLPIEWDNNIQKKDELKAVEPIKEVSILFGLIGKKIYGPWLEAVNQFSNIEFYNFSYDWRRDNNETADLFAEFLKKIKQKHGGKKVQVVSHSMGGIITLTIWNENPDLIDKVVFAGVPFRGGLGYLDNLYLGTPVGLNNKILSPEVIFTHPTFCAFFPAGQDFENQDLLVDENGKPIEVDYYNIEDWKRLGFGPYARQNQKKFNNLKKQQIHLQHVLQQAKKFRFRMKPKGNHYKKALVISSEAHSTLSKVRQLEIKDGEIPFYDFKIENRVPGDGSVSRKDMLPPKPVPYREFLTEHSHASLLNDPKVQREIEKFLAEE